MPSGTVRADRRAQLTIETLDRDGRSHPVDVVLDTGFTGSLTLPPETIRLLGLLYIGMRTFELADSQQVRFDTYLGSVSWHDRERLVVTLESDGAPLLGTRLLWGSRVTMDALAGGAVEIEELATAE